MRCLPSPKPPGKGPAVAAAGAVLASPPMASSLRAVASRTVLLLAPFALVACGQRDAGEAAAPVTAIIHGVLVTGPGQSMPEGMPLEVELAELSAATEAPPPLAAATLQSVAGAETPFALEYQTSKVQPDRTYVLRARAAIEGKTYLAGGAMAPVTAQAGDFPVDVVLRRPPNASPLYLDVSVLRLEYKGDADWSAKLREVMPGMLVCLRSVSGDGIGVAKAWPIAGGKVGVRIRSRDGNGFDCVALADGSKFESLTGLASFAPALPGEGDPVFIPAPASPQMAACRRYERVLGGVSETLGWLVYDTCPKDTPAAAQGSTPSS